MLKARDKYVTCFIIFINTIAVTRGIIIFVDYLSYEEDLVGNLILSIIGIVMQFLILGLLKQYYVGFYGLFKKIEKKVNRQRGPLNDDQ